jgi:preprotein translocase subunit SecD
MKGISLAKFLAVALVISLLGYVAYAGVALFKTAKNKEGFTVGSKYVRQGLDLKGGVYIVYQPETTAQITTAQMDSAKQVIRNRLDIKGLYDSTVTVDSVNNRLIVEIPGETSAQKAVSEIGRTAKLQFRDMDGNVIVEGSDIVDATSDNVGGGKWVVSLKFTPQASAKFSDATGRIAGLKAQNKNYIQIFLDQTMISNASVNQRIDSEGAIIEGGDFTAQSTKDLADLIRSGALPFKLSPVQVEGIGPSLGQKALFISVTAGAVAFAIVAVFMLLFYRLPGLVADIALIGYVALTIIILSGLKIPLTLPGIAGIILSVGMAVDANIIIFERVKEELRSGKTLRGAVDIGFKRALKPIVDANLTTIITATVLFFLGTGPIRGFALTLGLGVVLSFFTAITLTRYMLVQVMSLGLKHKWLYGHHVIGGEVNA